MTIISQLLSVLVLTFLLLLIAPIPALPASPEDEATVKNVLQAMVELDRTQDVDGLLANYAADAKMDSIVARGKVSKERYAAAMKQSQAQGQLGRNQMAKINSVTFPGPDRVIFEFDHDLDTNWGHRSYPLRWTLANREGRWLIKETEYLKK